MSLVEVAIFIGIGLLVALQFRRGGTDDGREVGELHSLLETEKMEKNKLTGQNKQMYAEQVSVKESLKSAERERDDLRKQVTRHEAQQEQHQKEFQRTIAQLEKAEEALKAERARVIAEEKEERERAERERDRLWADHENSVIAQLTSLCKSPQLAFSYFTNTNLPEEFDGSLKPDFMVGFLDQYIIFDAKVSKSESLQTYITNAVKTTVQKVKKNPKIATVIYLVVPTEAISELKTFVHPVDGYTIYIVSPESLAPILASLKKITTYEFADQMDPQQRENIVQLIADLDFHINLRNATDLILTKMGTEILGKTQQLDPEIAAEVAMRKQPMNAKASLAASEIKKIVSNLTEQNLEVERLVAPKAAVHKKNLKTAEMVIESLL